MTHAKKRILIGTIASVLAVSSVVTVPKLSDYLEDRKAWISAATTNTVTSYRGYLAVRANGRWIQEAKKHVQDFYDIAAQNYLDHRSDGYDSRASDAVIDIIRYAKGTDRHIIYIIFERHQGTSIAYSDIKTDSDERDTSAEISARFKQLIPEDILKFEQGKPSEPSSTLLVSYTVREAKSAYVPRNDPLGKLGFGPTKYQGLFLDWHVDLSISPEVRSYSYNFQTKPKKIIGYDRSPEGWASYNSDGIYHSMFYDCFQSFRRDFVRRLGVLL